MVSIIFGSPTRAYAKGFECASRHLKEGGEKSYTPVRLTNAIKAFEARNHDEWDEGYTEAFKLRLTELKTTH